MKNHALKAFATTAFLLSSTPATAEDKEIAGSLIPALTIGQNYLPEAMLNVTNLHKLRPLLTIGQTDPSNKNLGHFIVFGNEKGEWHLYSRQNLALGGYTLIANGTSYDDNRNQLQSVMVSTQQNLPCENLANLFNQDGYVVIFKGDNNSDQDIKSVMVLANRLNNGDDNASEYQKAIVAMDSIYTEGCMPIIPHNPKIRVSHALLTNKTP